MKSLISSFRKRVTAATLTTLLAGSLALNTAQPAQAQDGTTSLGGAAIALMFLGGLTYIPVAEEGGPGYVDLVGRPCDVDCDEAKWGVSMRPLYSQTAPFQHITTQRIVVPKNVGKPVLRNAQVRSSASLPMDTWNSDTHPVLDMSEAEVGALAPDQRVVAELLRHLETLTTEDRATYMDELWAAFATANPEAIHYAPSVHGGGEVGEPALSGLGGLNWWHYGANQYLGFPQEFVEPVPALPLRDSNGDLAIVRSVTELDDGSLRVVYQPQPQDLENSIVTTEDRYTFQGMTTNFDRVVYEAIIPAADIATTTALPPGTIIDADPERDLASFYQIAAAKLGVPYDGTISHDMEGWLYGDMVLPKANHPIDVYEVTGDQSTLIPVKEPGATEAPPAGEPMPGAAYPSKVGPNGSVDPMNRATPTLAYTVSDSEEGNYWVIDVMVPPMQVEFELAAVKDEAAIASGAKYAAAQAYTYESCTRFRNDPDWTCTSLLDYDWGRGGTTTVSTGKTVLTEGVVRGRLEIDPAQELLFDAQPDTLPLRGIFGNDQCMVTRPTEDPTNYQALASTILPSDFNYRFPGQETNNVGPDAQWLRTPFSNEIYMEGVNTGEPFTIEDACDQAAVPLVCEEAPSEPGDGSSGDGSALAGSALLGSSIFGSALLSSGSSGSAAPDGSSSSTDAPATPAPGATPGVTPTATAPATQPGQPTDPAAPAQTTIATAPQQHAAPTQQTEQNQAQPRGLAQTGAAVTGLVGVAALALLAGAGLLVARRRK